MASICTLVFVLLVICISAGNANTDFVRVECSSTSVGQYGQRSLLMCAVHTTPEVLNPEIRVVTWKKKGAEKSLLVFYNHLQTLEDRYRFAESAWDNKNMNVSLLITNTGVADEGDYTCTVITDSGESKGQTRLDVTAKYNAATIQSTPEKIPPGADGTLTCRSDSGYPKGHLRWFDQHGTDWTESSEMEASQTENGLFQLSSKLILKSGSVFKYICILYNGSNHKVTQSEFDPAPDTSIGGKIAENKPEAKLDSKIVAPVVVIGSLIVGLLCALVFLLRRSQRTRKHSTIPIMDVHEQVLQYNVEEGHLGSMDTNGKLSNN